MIAMEVMAHSLRATRTTHLILHPQIIVPEHPVRRHAKKYDPDDDGGRDEEEGGVDHPRRCTRRSMMKNCTSGNFDVGGNFDGVGQLLNGNNALCTIMHHYA